MVRGGSGGVKDLGKTDR